MTPLQSRIASARRLVGLALLASVVMNGGALALFCLWVARVVE